MYLTLITVGVTNGILLGLLFALMASGFNLSFGIAKIVNFQHGGMVLWAMYASYIFWLKLGISPIISVIPISIVWFILGYLLQRYLVSYSLKGPEDSQILFAVGMLMIFQHFAQLNFSDDALLVQDNLLTGSITLGEQVVQNNILYSSILAIAILTCLHFILNKTTLGRELKACSQNTTGSKLCGLNVQHLYAVSLGLSSVCAAVSGVTMTLLTSIIPERAYEYALISVVISVVGGLGNMFGCILGGLIVGIVDNLCQIMGYGSMSHVGVYLLVFIIFLFRPDGIIKPNKSI